MYTFYIKKHELEFIKPAKTSRNVFDTRTIYIIHLVDTKTGKEGIGEAAPLKMLSIDDVHNYEDVLHQKFTLFCESGSIEELQLAAYPSIKFGLETALLNLQADEWGRMYQTPFTLGKSSIPVNGLVWMDSAEAMYLEALAKIEAGFNVIKFKVGALDFDEECRLLEKIRNQFSAFKVALRLDANGGFKADEALEQMQELSRFELHSIEQPIAPKKWDCMQKLCVESPIDIALDEELIGVVDSMEQDKLVQLIKPQYLILKPNLIGGVGEADKWIVLARRYDIRWWATSALESNIGLSAIAQWVSTYDNPLHQGLGTGALFSNNFSTSLNLINGEMHYNE